MTLAQLDQALQDVPADESALPFSLPTINDEDKIRLVVEEAMPKEIDEDVKDKLVEALMTHFNDVAEKCDDILEEGRITRKEIVDMLTLWQSVNNSLEGKS